MLPLWIRLYRLIFGMTALIAVYWNWQDFDDPDFWKFFTNQSNVIAGVVLILGALVFARARSVAWWDIFRGIAVIAMLVTGIVYAVLLDGVYNPFTTTDHTWASSVLHQLMPLVMVIDIIVVPLSPRTSRWSVLFYLMYPLAYLGWFLYSGAQDGWYPYDFIDHTTYDNGYTGVLMTAGGLLAVFIVMGLVIIGYSHMRRTRWGDALA
jgi:hypothetical protein